MVGLVSVFFLLLLASCGTTTKSKGEKETSADSTLMYTFNIDDSEYRFRLFDGWIKYPNKDESILFLVGNKEKKAFMTAGFEAKTLPLEDYKEQFIKKLQETDADIISQSDKKNINDLDVFSIEFTMKDAKERTSTYQTNLIETSDYFINLGAWTSQEKPDEQTKEHLNKILSTFEQIK